MPSLSHTALDPLLMRPLAPEFAEAECARLAPRLPTRWNSGLNSHGFVYSHIQSSMQFVVKVDRLGGKTEIRGLAVGDERIVRTEISARDYISTAALPLRIARADDGSEDRSDLEDRLRKVFISDERIAGELPSHCN